MAQGFIRSFEDDQELEYIGKQYFNYLYSRSFFQEVEDVGMGSVTCKMHDLVHDLALYVSQDLAVVTHDSSNVNENARHALLCYHDLPQSMLKAKKLRTMLILKLTQMNVCFKFKYLRVLSLSYQKDDDGVKILDSIGGLVHLRYLSFRIRWKLKRLPHSICKLHQLQTLYVYSHSLEELPSNIRHMSGLRDLRLHTERQTRLEAIKYLTSLRTFVN